MQTKNLFCGEGTSCTGTPRIGKIQALLGILFLAVTGWKVAGSVPDSFGPCATHLQLGSAIYPGRHVWTGSQINWFGKKELFHWPVGGVFKWLGGIPIDRSSHQNVVQQTAQTIRERKQIVIGIAPEGTRSQTSHWNTGFYYIASLAQVPIVFGYLDYARKVGGLGLMMHTTDNIEADMKVIREFYSGITAKYPRNVGEMIVSQNARPLNAEQDIQYEKS